MKTRTDRVKVETHTLAYYTLVQAAEKVGMKASRLHEMVSTGEFRPEISLGLAIVFTDSDITRLRPLAKAERKKESVRDEGQQMYTVAQLAKEWGLSTDTIRTIFRNEPGVITYKGKSKSKRKRPRSYVTLRIPIEVAERVKRRRAV